MKTLRLAASCALAMILLSAGAATAGIGPQGPVHDLLPDVRMARLYGFSIETRPNGRVWLHFGTIGWSIGKGPLEARGLKVDPSDRYMHVKQRIYTSAGGFHDRVSPAVMIFNTGDHHRHWHVRQFMVVNMYTVGDPTGNVYGLRKIGYCLLDFGRLPNPPPNSPPHRVYPLDACGHKDDLKVRMGLSIGYGDDYPPFFAHQWMDITGIASGDYRICATVDPLKEFVESNETNNARRTDVHINMSTKRVSVLSSAITPCGPDVP
jgi:hypothetical protein